MASAEETAASMSLGGRDAPPGEQEDLDLLENDLPGIRSKVHYVDAPLLEIASREIRNRIVGGKPFQYYLHPAVYVYIKENHLYQEGDSQF